jgi:monoterpene epsilon-lactone hydrolase
MTSHRVALCAALVALVAIVAGQAWPADRPAAPAARVVSARRIPVPTTVSPELQKAIAAPAWNTPIPKNAAGWRRLREQYDEAGAKEARALWKQLEVTVAPLTVGGVKCHLVKPKEVPAAKRSRLLVHFHGGAYVFNGGEASTSEATVVAHASETVVLSVDYRMPPEHPFPAALDDAVAVWKAVIAEHEPERTGLFGTSAGGGLAMAAVLELQQRRLPLPGALFLGSPWADLSKTGDTYFTNAGVDNLIPRYEGLLAAAALLYAGASDIKAPLVSPIYGDLRGFPPTILISGTRDLFSSLVVRVHRKLRQADVEAELHVFEGQSHAQYLTSYPSPEASEALGEVARFFDRHLER